MNADNARRNYTKDRSSRFKHPTPSDMLLPSAPTVQDYVNNEKSKQMNKIRDWYRESEDSQTDIIALRSSSYNLRKISIPSPVQKLDHHKGYILGGVCIAAIIGGLMFFVHF